VVRELRWEALRAKSEPRALFSYSYTALEPFRAARERGWFTVLGQIDPGPVEERLVAEAHAAHPELRTKWHPAPSRYWDAWREECELADCVMVNSTWSREALVQEGVPVGKIAVVPLVYEPPAEAAGFVRAYPDRFTPERPLRVLFLGQVNVRKGMGHVLEAMRRLAGAPVEWWIVGPPEFAPPADLAGQPAIHWTGPVGRGEVTRFYREADVFLFPTLSDGFGLTQLEAMAWGLPVIATQRCGDVVTEGVDGLRLSDVTAESIVSAVNTCLTTPATLRSWAAQATRAAARFPLSGLAGQLDGLTPSGVAA
jgi:glycosyltransferase involved in cell wall biosynthesis